jgi:hypothetical protein
MAKKNNSVSITDELLLQTYKMGWDDCFSGDNSNCLAFKDSPLLTRAYENGWSDYITGDDVTSVDEQTDEEILEWIKRKDD